MRRIFLTLAAVGVLSLALAACDDTQTGDGGRTASASPTSDAEVSASPSDGVVTSEEVTVRGTVSMRLADRAFLLSDPVLVEGTAPNLGSDVAVIVTGDGASIEQSDQVVVRGTVHAAQVGDELAWIEDQLNVDLPDALASVLSGAQLLLADSVEAP